MLHARIEIAQILDVFQVRAVIHEFAPATDPTVWTSSPITLELPEDVLEQDSLSIILECIRLWSEMTNPK